jgi:putative ABC transport system substrate-binding protein
VNPTRRSFLGALAGGLLGAPVIAPAQQTGKISRIGYLAGGSATANSRFREAFRHELSALGWAEAQSIAIEYRYADGLLDRLPGLAAELVRLEVDVIVAAPAAAAVAAKNATATIPIVMSGVGLPVQLGLIANLARPGGNVSGVAFDAGSEMYTKGLELLKDVVPRARRIAALWNPSNPARAAATDAVNSAARSIGMQLLNLEARAPAEIDAAFASMVKERVGALLVVADALFAAHRERIAQLAIKNRLPSVAHFREFADAGSLMSYGPNLVVQWRRAAVFVDKILRGAKPAELPVEQPTQFELVLNLKTAKALGLALPPALLQRADDVIR